MTPPHRPSTIALTFVVVALGALLVWLAIDRPIVRDDALPARPMGVKVDLNRAPAGEIALLPGIGPGVAGRIVDDREHNGLFHGIEDLRRVKGVGEKIARQIEPYVKFGASGAINPDANPTARP